MPLILCCPKAAIAVVLSIASYPTKPETICLLLNRHHGGVGALKLEECPRDLPDMAIAIPEVIGRFDDVSAVVLATVCPSLGFLPTAPEEIAFLEGRERLGLLGVDLLDWYLLDEGYAASLADATAAESLWRRSAGCSVATECWPQPIPTRTATTGWGPSPHPR